MQLKCLAQGSTGNCWILKHGQEMLLLDAGIPSKQIVKGIDYNLMGVQGVLISHTHKDHALAVNDLEKMGLKVFKPYETDQRVRKYGSFKVQAFSVPHGNCECYGFYIKIADRRLIYATDFEYLPYTFFKQAITDFVIECNYQNEYLNKDAENLLHKVTGHCELETTIGIVKANLTSELQNVIITHLGVETCNGLECVGAIKRVVPETVKVDYAQAGRTWYLE